MKPKIIEIHGRRWFNRRSGSTFHTVKIYVDDDLVYVTPEQYGYDNGYAQTACDWLKDAGYLPDLQEHAGGSREPLWAYCRRTGCALVDTVEDVRRERDLHQPLDEEHTRRILAAHKGRRQGWTHLVTEPHAQCEHAGRCVEHARDPDVEACR